MQEIRRSFPVSIVSIPDSVVSVPDSVVSVPDSVVSVSVLYRDPKKLHHSCLFFIVLHICWFTLGR